MKHKEVIFSNCGECAIDIREPQQWHVMPQKDFFIYVPPRHDLKTLPHQAIFACKEVPPAKNALVLRPEYNSWLKLSVEGQGVIYAHLLDAEVHS